MKTKSTLILTLFMALIVQLSFAQQNTISGTVSDENGLPLLGATIVISGTTSGTTTDFDGNYKINANTGDVLTFSYVGYQNQNITIGNSNTVNVTLQLDNTLDEVVVTAQGIKREKKALGYSVSTLKSSEVESRPEGDIARVLNGKIAGVDIVGTGGLAGSGTNINIRGPLSISGSNQPLFVVNGVPFNTSTNAQSNVTTGNGSSSASSRFLDLDPNNIESVSVLKGFSATVLYGEQGRNGVILITTKTGSSESAKKGFEITLNQSVFLNKIANLPDYQNTYGQGGDNSVNVGYVGNWGGRFDQNLTVAHHYSGNASFPEYFGTTTTYQPFEDNVKDFFRTGLGTTTSVNASKSTDNASFNINFGRTDEEGFVPGNNFGRINFSVGGKAKLSNKFDISSSFNYTRTNFETPPVAANNGTGNFSIFSRTLFIPRNLDLNGLPYQDPFTGASVYYRTDQENPLWLVDNSKETVQSNRFFNSVTTTYNISELFSLSYRVGLDTYTEKQDFYMNKGGVSSTDAQNGFYKSTSGTNTIWDHTFLFNTNNLNIVDKLALNTSLGFNSNSEVYDQIGVYSTQQVVFGFIDHNNFQTQSNSDNLGSSLDYKQTVNRYGLFGKLDFSYINYLYLTLAARNDWISTVETENQSLFYPSVSLSFIPTSAFENINSNALNFLKLRFGIASSAEFPTPYTTRPLLAQGTASFTTQGGTPLNTISAGSLTPNPDLKPAKYSEIEAGLEARFWNSRISLETSIYKRKTTDQILFEFTPTSTGGSSQQVNIGQVDTKGIEVDLGITPVRNDNFNWNTNFVFSAYENEVIKTTSGGDNVFISGFSNLGNYAIEGQPFGVILGSYALRDNNGNYLINPTTGNIIDSDAVSLDNKIIGDPNPDWKATNVNTISYKGLSLSTQFEYTHGGDFSSNTIGNLLRRGVTTDTDNREGTIIIPGYLADPTTGSPLVDASGNQIANNIQLGTNEVYFLNFMDPSDQGIFDGSVFRLRELRLSYDIPRNLLNKTPFGSISLSIIGNNLWYWAPNVPKGTNFDPEVISTGVGNGRGLEFQTAPTSKKYGFNIKVTF